MGQHRRHSDLTEAAREAWKAPRYPVVTSFGDKLVLNERARRALGRVAQFFRVERGTPGTYPGDVAATLHDGNGWTASVTLRSLERRGLVRKLWVAGSYSQHYAVTDEGLFVLRQLDVLYEREGRCPVCEGNVDPRESWVSGRPFGAPPECEACGDTGLRPVSGATLAA